MNNSTKRINHSVLSTFSSQCLGANNMKSTNYLKASAQAATATEARHFALLLPVESMQRRCVRVTTSTAAAAARTARRVYGAGAAATVRTSQRIAIADADVTVTVTVPVHRMRGAVVVVAATGVRTVIGRAVLAAATANAAAAAQKFRRSPATDVGQPIAQHVQADRRAGRKALRNKRNAI